MEIFNNLVDLVPNVGRMLGPKAQTGLDVTFHALADVTTRDGGPVYSPFRP